MRDPDGGWTDASGLWSDCAHRCGLGRVDSVAIFIKYVHVYIAGTVLHNRPLHLPSTPSGAQCARATAAPRPHAPLLPSPASKNTARATSSFHLDCRDAFAAARTGVSPLRPADSVFRTKPRADDCSRRCSATRGAQARLTVSKREHSRQSECRCMLSAEAVAASELWPPEKLEVFLFVPIAERRKTPLSERNTSANG